MNAKASVAPNATEDLYQAATEAEDPIMRSVWARIADHDKARERPATDEQLAKIWQLWNALPAELLQEEKRRILTFEEPTDLDEGTDPDPDPKRRAHFEKLRRRFPGLPLCKHEYNQALGAAVHWSNLLGYVQTTFQLHKGAVVAQLDYSTFDNVLTGRVAIYRTVKELEITHPGLLERAAPSLADFDHFQQRYATYLQAGDDAIELLSPLVFLPSFLVDQELPADEQAFGVPNPPENFPHHIYIARLAAFGKCTPKRLADFFAERFLKLTRRQKAEFCNEYHRPTKGRERWKYPFLPVWLADNAPLFNIFKLRWADILDLAKQHFNGRAPEDYRSCPESPDNLKVIWKEHEDKLWPGQPRRIVPPIGRPRAGESPSVPAGLLTPLPFVPAARKG